MKMLRLGLLLVAAGSASAGAQRIEADFVAGPRIAVWTDAVERGGDWGCSGEVVKASIDRMPDPEVMSGDDIHELDVQGRVLRTWQVPLEADPLGIAGERLIVRLTRTAGDPVVSVDAQGELRRVASPAALPESAYAKCPANPALPVSAFRWCVSLPDQAAPNLVHLIAYEGPCT